MLYCTWLGQTYDSLESLHLYSAFEDWILGGPKATEMPELLKLWESRTRALYPGWPVHSAVQPGDFDEAGYLVNYLCIGFFTASESREAGRSGSAMVLVWYQKQMPGRRRNATVYCRDRVACVSKGLRYLNGMSLFSCRPRNCAVVVEKQRLSTPGDEPGKQLLERNPNTGLCLRSSHLRGQWNIPRAKTGWYRKVDLI